MESKNIITHKVYNVIKLKNKYGFRVLLKFDDVTEEVRQYSGIKTKKEAELEREKIIAQLVTKTFIVYKKQLVTEFLNEWLENDIKVRTTANTYSLYRNTIKNHINPLIGKTILTELSRIQIKNMYISIAENSHKLAEISKSIMNSSMRYAVNKGKLSENPANDVPLPKNIKGKAYHTRAIKENKTLNLEQIAILINASENTGIHMQILFAALMGLRRGEINGLKYSDVDFIHQKLHVVRQLGRAPNSDEVKLQPKTKTKQEIKLKTESSERVLDIPDCVFEAILKERKQYEKNRSKRSKSFQDLDFICCSTYGRPRSMQYHFQPFKKLLKENGLPDIRWHDLRHSYSTLLLKNDFNLKVISKTLGHAKEIVTADNYINNQEIIADGVGELKNYISDVLPEETSGCQKESKVYDHSDFKVEKVFGSYIA